MCCLCVFDVHLMLTPGRQDVTRGIFLLSNHFRRIPQDFLSKESKMSIPSMGQTYIYYLQFVVDFYGINYTLRSHFGSRVAGKSALRCLLPTLSIRGAMYAPTDLEEVLIQETPRVRHAKCHHYLTVIVLAWLIHVWVSSTNVAPAPVAFMKAHKHHAGYKAVALSGISSFEGYVHDAFEPLPVSGGTIVAAETEELTAQSARTETTMTTLHLKCTQDAKTDMKKLAPGSCALYADDGKVCILASADEQAEMPHGELGCGIVSENVLTGCGKYDYNEQEGLCSYSAYGTGCDDCDQAIEQSDSGSGKSNIPCKICLKHRHFCTTWRYAACKLRKQARSAGTETPIFSAQSVLNLFTAVVLALGIASAATYPTTAFTIIRPFASAIDMLRIVALAFIITYELILLIVAQWNGDAAILSDEFQGPTVAMIGYETTLIGHCGTVAVIVVDLLLSALTGQLDQWWEHVAAHLNARLVWGICGVAYTFSQYVWAAA